MCNYLDILVLGWLVHWTLLGSEGLGLAGTQLRHLIRHFNPSPSQLLLLLQLRLQRALINHAHYPGVPFRTFLHSLIHLKLILLFLYLDYVYFLQILVREGGGYYSGY